MTRKRDSTNIDCLFDFFKDLNINKFDHGHKFIIQNNSDDNENIILNS